MNWERSRERSQPTGGSGSVVSWVRAADPGRTDVSRLKKSLVAIASLTLMVGLAPGAAAGSSNRPDHAANSAEQANEQVVGTPSWSRHLQKQVEDSGWDLVWSDEFQGNTIDDSKWEHEVNCWGGGNNERQCYTDRGKNSFVRGGLLNIVAHQEQFTGPALQDDHPDYPGGDKTQDYTSARLRTKGKFDFRYGRVDVRAQVPGGQGMWPAIWMLPTDWVYGEWPASGEIDIFEAVNLARDDFAGWGDVIHGTLHYGLQWPQWSPHGASKYLDENPANDFHIYSIEWEPDEIRWYLDGEHWQTQRSDGWWNHIWGGQETGFHTPNDRAPFDENFHILLNLAVGGDWPQDPDPTDADWPNGREMLVDYVRVYECGDGPESCSITNPDVAVNSAANGPGINAYSVYDGGVQTLEFDVDGVGAVENTPVPGSFAFPGVSVDSNPGPDGWAVDFGLTGGPLEWGASIGNVFLTAQDMGGVDGVLNGLRLAGGTGWTNNGELEFDLTVNSIAEDTRLYVKMDSGYPLVGFVEIDPPAAGTTEHVAVRISELLSTWNPWEAPLDASNINNLFVLEATGPASVVIDGIELSCAYNTEAPDWQADKTCELAPRVPIGSDEEIHIDNVVIEPATGFGNGDFEAGLDGWTNWIGNGGAAAIDVTDGYAKIAIEERGQATWSIQFFQEFALEPGTYNLSFDARSTVDRVIDVSVEDANFVHYEELGSIRPALTGEWQQVTGSFTVWEGAQPTAFLKFLVGAEP